jgi:hypothetical protein
MVDSICWTIRTNQLYKNDVMMLDIIATSDWKRPLYFAAPSSVSHCFNVDSFCLVQGWVYKFMPVKAGRDEYIPGMGGVDAVTSYDLIRNKFAWGNLSDPHVYIDPESLNNSIRAKTNVLRTSQELIGMRKFNEAILLMDDYFRNFPESKFPFDMFIAPFAEMYYRCGEPSKADRILKKITRIYDENLDYYYSFTPKLKENFQKDIEQSLGTIRHMSMIAERYGRKQLMAEIDSVFNIKIKGY